MTGGPAIAAERTDGVEPVLFDRLDAIAKLGDGDLAGHAEGYAGELLAAGETVLEAWLAGHGRDAGVKPVEGYRLLGLHRAGARGDPSFNACRETCRELVYRTNCARVGGEAPEIARQLRLGAMVARHLALFIDGKLETEGLGEFCCSSRGLRGGNSGPAPIETPNRSE